jgi:hypothetical protein
MRTARKVRQIMRTGVAGAIAYFSVRLRFEQSPLASWSKAVEYGDEEFLLR